MTDTLADVREVLIESLELQHGPEDLAADLPLLGSLPELDSMGIVVLAAALEERFAITIEDEEFDAELFETVGTLAAFIEAKLATR